MTFFPLGTVVLVSKSWRIATNHQMTRLKYHSTSCHNITDAAVQALASCPNHYDSTNITDAAVQALASSCPNLTTVSLLYCRNITDAAVQALAISCPGCTIRQ